MPVAELPFSVVFPISLAFVIDLPVLDSDF